MAQCAAAAREDMSCNTVNFRAGDRCEHLHCAACTTGNCELVADVACESHAGPAPPGSQRGAEPEIQPTPVVSHSPRGELSQRV